MKAPPSVVAITQEVAAQHQVTVGELISPSRRQDLTRARFVIWHRIREEIRFTSGRPPSFPLIGRWFGGRDHSTIVSGVQRYSELDCSPRPRSKRWRRYS